MYYFQEFLDSLVGQFYLFKIKFNIQKLLISLGTVLNISVFSYVYLLGYCMCFCNL